MNTIYTVPVAPSPKTVPESDSVGTPMVAPAPGGTHPTPADYRPRQPLYVATWWEKRFPWLLDLFCSLDPDPLLGRLARVFVPFRTAVEVLCTPLAIAIEALGRSTQSVWASSMSGLGRWIHALPLPKLARQWLWLRPARLRDAQDSAQMALKRQHAVTLPLSLLAAVLAHASVIFFSPVIEAADFSVTADELMVMKIPPTVEIPPAPIEIPRPANPVIAPALIDEDITIAPTTFAGFSVAALPPPPTEVVEDVPDRPSFTPFTVAPRLLNVEEVTEMMLEEYPPLLRSAGIGGDVVVAALVNHEGRVQEVRVAGSSGHESLDAAALRVADRMIFSPALNRDVVVPAWVRFPIQFKVR